MGQRREGRTGNGVAGFIRADVGTDVLNGQYRDIRPRRKVERTLDRRIRRCQESLDRRVRRGGEGMRRDEKGGRLTSLKDRKACNDRDNEFE